MRGFRGDLLKRLAAWPDAGRGLVLAALLIGASSAPEAPAPERPALRFAHNLWPGYFPITLARELGYYTRESVAAVVFGHTVLRFAASYPPRLYAYGTIHRRMDEGTAPMTA